MDKISPNQRLDRSLRPGARLTLLAQTLFLLGFSLSGVYVNIFLFRVSGSLADIGWYHFYQYIGLTLGFIMAGQWAERRDRTAIVRIGTVAHALFFLIILVLGDRSAHLVRELGLLLGVGGGFFWLGTHTIMFDLTNDANRDRFYGLYNILGSAVAMLAPFAAGALLARLPGDFGYRVIFGLSLASLVASVIVTLFLWRVESDGVFNLGEALRSNANPAWRHIMWINALVGVRDGVFVFLVGLLLFIASGNEFAVGSLALVGGAVTMVMAWVVGARVHVANRRQPLQVGFFATALSPLVLVWSISPLSIFIFTLVEATFSPMYDIPFEALSHKVLESDPDSGRMRVEYMVAREIPLNLGRLVGATAFIYAAPYMEGTPHIIRLFVALVGCVPIASWWAHRAILTDEGRMQVGE